MDNNPTISLTLIFPRKVPGGWPSAMFTPITPNEIFDSRDRIRFLPDRKFKTDTLPKSKSLS